jgi:ribonuclease HI
LVFYSSKYVDLLSTASLCINLHVKGHQSLVKLAEHYRIKLIWVPGHKKIEENEISDQLDREGSSNPFTGT